MIVSDPQIMLGKPVIQGTRVTVEAILETLNATHVFETPMQAA
jgi:uncharacterized protein (DUF433 family)